MSNYIIDCKFNVVSFPRICKIRRTCSELPAQQGGPYLSKVIKIISHLTFSMQNLILSNFCFLEHIPKMPPQLVKMHFLFTKEFAQKYIGKIDISFFCIFCFIFFDSKGFLPHRSIRLIDTVLLIPILPYFMTFYVTWHMS